MKFQEKELISKDIMMLPGCGRKFGTKSQKATDTWGIMFETLGPVQRGLVSSQEGPDPTLACGGPARPFTPAIAEAISALVGGGGHKERALKQLRQQDDVRDRGNRPHPLQ